MTTLHLGVLDVPYAAPTKRLARSGRGKRRNLRPISVTVPSTTTGDVAEILEDHYHIMEVFYEDLGPTVIGDAIVRAMMEAFEAKAMGGPADVKLAADAETEIQDAFRIFLSEQHMDNLGIPGVPTAASLAGVNHRFKHPYAKSNPPRPSFIDTGLYEQSFRAEID